MRLVSPLYASCSRHTFSEVEGSIENLQKGGLVNYYCKVVATAPPSSSLLLFALLDKSAGDLDGQDSEHIYYLFSLCSPCS